MKKIYFQRFFALTTCATCLLLLIVLPARTLYSEVMKTNDNYFYTFQTATLSNRQSAENLVKELKEKGYPAYILAAQTKQNKKIFKIRIGEYETPAEAEKAAKEFKGREHRDYFVLRSASINRAPEPMSEPKPVPASPVPEKDEIKEPPQPSPGITKEKDTGKLLYTIQVGTELRKDVAEKMIKELQDKGYPAYMVTKRTSHGMMLYKIRIGQYRSKAEARIMSDKFNKKEKKPSIIVKSTPGTLKNVIGVSEMEKPKQESPWPGQVTKIFAYTSNNGDLNLTNHFNSIPPDLRDNIKYVSIFPVRFVKTKKTDLICEIEGKTKKIRLAGVKFSKKKFTDSTLDYFKQTIKDGPVRLKYSPGFMTKDGTILGKVYLKNGTYLNVEIIRIGLASLDPKTVPEGQMDIFKNAEAKAKEDMLGIWSPGCKN